MNDMQRTQVAELRAKGYSYGKISLVLGISTNTVKTFCKRNGLGGIAERQSETRENSHFCLCCGIPVIQSPGRKEKKFCSDKCRNKWWNAHLDQVNRKASYDYVCPCCKKPFRVYGNKNRKYCSHECYIKDRFGGDRYDE